MPSPACLPPPAEFAQDVAIHLFGLLLAAVLAGALARLAVSAILARRVRRRARLEFRWPE